MNNNTRLKSGIMAQLNDRYYYCLAQAVIKSQEFDKFLGVERDCVEEMVKQIVLNPELEERTREISIELVRRYPELMNHFKTVTIQ